MLLLGVVMLQESEVPQGRVNITIDVADNGAQVKKELPLRVLVCGEFSQQDSLAAITPNRVTARSISNLIKHYQPKLNLPAKLGCKQLSIKDLSDFKPDKILQQVPKLRDLYALRNLLKDLRTNALDSNILKENLKVLFRDKSKCCELAKPLHKEY